MVDLLEWLHKYVPGHDSTNDETKSKQPVKILSGGDYLTFERHKGAQSSIQDAWTASARLKFQTVKNAEKTQLYNQTLNV